MSGVVVQLDECQTAHGAIPIWEMTTVAASPMLGKPATVLVGRHLRADRAPHPRQEHNDHPQRGYIPTQRGFFVKLLHIFINGYSLHSLDI
jgi:hypothetical protein